MTDITGKLMSGDNVAATVKNGIITDYNTLERLKGECVKEVKRLNGNFTFKDANDWQKG